MTFMLPNLQVKLCQVMASVHRIEGPSRLGQSEIVQAFRFSFIGAEDPVPNDQDAAIVAVPRRPMMHSVVEWRVEEILQDAQAPAKFCMNPELVQRVELRVNPQDCAA